MFCLVCTYAERRRQKSHHYLWIALFFLSHLAPNCSKEITRIGKQDNYPDNLYFRRSTIIYSNQNDFYLFDDCI